MQRERWNDGAIKTTRKKVLRVYVRNRTAGL